jgi:RNA recognition motif-containing protein
MHGIVHNGIPPQKSQRNALHVCDLGEGITEGDLDIFFQDFKEDILMLQLNRNHRQTDTTKNSNATIVFKDPTTANNAKDALNLKKLRGKTIRISYFDKDNSVRYSNVSNLFIKNIPESVSPREVYEHFLKFGEIQSAKMCEDDDGNHLGYGYLQYSHPDSMQKAIDGCDGKAVWGDSKLEVKQFLKKNERIGNSMNENKSIYIKFVSSGKENVTTNVSDKELQDMLKKHGKVQFFNSFKDKTGRSFYIVTYESEDAAINAKAELHGKKIGSDELFVDLLMKKTDRKRLVLSKINENTSNLNTTYRFCNLYIKNIPLDVKEEQLHEIFGKFGEIKSIKIQKYILVTKVNNVLKEYPTSKGFGFVCFMDKDAATAAKDTYNENFLPGYEKAKRPLLIDFFMPKHERKNILNRVQQQMNPQARQKQMMAGLPFNMNFNPNYNPYMKMMKQQMGGGNFQKINPIMNVNNNMSIYENNVQQMPATKFDEPDVNYLNSLEDDNAKRDYLGEFIFKNVENHPLTVKRNLTIDDIGKITGMILGIEDIQEIIDISKNERNLNSRIQEALELLDQNK